MAHPATFTGSRRARLTSVVVATALALALALALACSVAPAGAAAGRSVAAKRTVSTACPARTQQSRKRCARGRAVFEHVAGRARLWPATNSSAAGGTDAAGAGTSAGGGSGGATAAPSAPDTTAAGAAPVARTLGADAYDFGTFVLRLTRAAVPAGSLTIYFRNHDPAEHNLWLDPPQLGAPPVQISDAVGENGGGTKTVAVTAGTWRLYCSLAGHGSMTRDLAVG